MKHKVMTIDVEMTGLDPWHDTLLLIAYRFDGIGPVQQVKVYENENPNDEFIVNLADPTVTKRGHNCHFDLLCLSSKGFVVKGPIDDTRILAYAEDPQQELDLKGLVERKLNKPVVRLEELGPNRLLKEIKAQSDVVKAGKIYITKAARPKFEEYNKADVENCDALRQQLINTDWYKTVEQPLAKILFEAEQRGIQLDVSYLKELENAFSQSCEEKKQAFGKDFNPNSPQQVKARFEKEGTWLESTDKHTLKLLSWKGNELASRLLSYRSLSKLLGTYVKPLLEQAVEGRIHGRFNQAGRESESLGDIKGTATGRLSSSDPNLQNIPDRTEEGRKVRRSIIATSGMILIDSDLKQIEPRLIAHYSQSKVLLNAYNKGLDTHAIMGGLIFNKAPETLTKLERFIGKTSWLATVYGCWYKKLRQIVEINSDEPIFYDDEFYQRVQDSFWAANPEIRTWREQHIKTASDTGCVTTIGGRVIKLERPEFRSKFGTNQFDREAVNYQIQGSAADVMKMIIVKMFKYPTTMSLLATIHDEVLIEAYHIENATAIKDTMQSTVTLKNVPVEADTKIIKDWSEK